MTAGARPSNATRSAACLSWQDSICDHVADRCQSMSRSLCDAEFQTLFCESDEAVQACIEALPSATCPDTPEPCKQVADREPARWYCLTFIDLLCGRGEACGLEESAQCKQNAGVQLDCEDAVGAEPDVETCLSKLASWSCQSLGAGQLPAECDGVIRLAGVSLSGSRRALSLQL